MTLRRLTLAVAVLALPWSGIPPALASWDHPVDAGQRLKELEGQLERSRAEHDEIKQKAATLAEETTRLRADMVKAAR
ncbi:MAG: peptidase M23, partial [Magnetospirillum sp.]